MAEVLVTLVVLGLAAALTIPILIKDYQKQETVTALQKSYSSLNQSFIRAQIENGASTSWPDPSSNWNDAASTVWWNTYFIPYANFSISKTCTDTTRYECFSSSAKWLDGKPFNVRTNLSYILLSDGTSILFGAIGDGHGEIYVDINGLKKPNVVGKDIFEILFEYQKGDIILYGKGISRTNLLSDQDAGCNKNPGNLRGQLCGGLIQLDGWKIGDGYPWD